MTMLVIQDIPPGEGDNGTDSNFTFFWKDDFDSFDNNRWEKSDDHTWGGNQSLFIDDNIFFENGNKNLFALPNKRLFS